MAEHKRIVWKIGAPAGFGVLTTGLTVSKLATRSGMQIFDYLEYPSLIRGGHNTYEVVISPEPVNATVRHLDYLVCLNKETFELHQERLSKDSVIVFDPGQFTPEGTLAQHVAVPFTQLIAELQAETVMLNMIAIGASLALMGGKLELIDHLIAQEFARKEPIIVTQNTACAHAGFNYVKERYPELCSSFLASAPASEPLAVIMGNDAFSLGAVAADCRLYAAYPMSPSSGVLSNLAAWQNTSQMVVRHAEDEIGVVNEVLGASFAGVRAATGTSGGGFALMAETLSYAGVAELPLVVFVAQRPGPATGMPTWTEQGDLLFAAFAGHGEFPKIVLAPGDCHEMIELTKKAFDLAEIYQTPVVVLSDKYLSESHQSFSVSELSRLLEQPLRHGKTVTTAAAPYLRYAVTPDGISPRLVPGMPGAFYQANSYEHLPDSHTSESAEVRIAQVDKRAQKIKTYFESDFALPKFFGEPTSADCIIVGWGSTKGIALEAQKLLAQSGTNASYLHFTHVYPLDSDQLRPLLSLQKPYILLENNSEAQLGKLLRMSTGFVADSQFTKYDGRPFYPEEVTAFIMKGSV